MVFYRPRNYCTLNYGRLLKETPFVTYVQSTLKVLTGSMSVPLIPNLSLTDVVGVNRLVANEARLHRSSAHGPQNGEVRPLDLNYLSLNEWCRGSENIVAPPEVKSTLCGFRMCQTHDL